MAATLCRWGVKTADTKPPPPPSPSGGGEAVRPGRPDVRRVPGRALRGKVRPVLLRQRHLPAVLLRVLLGQHPQPGRPRVPQAAGQRGGGPAAPDPLPLELETVRGDRKLSYQYNPVRNTIQDILYRYIYIYISFVAAKHQKPQFFTKTPPHISGSDNSFVVLSSFLGGNLENKKEKEREIFVGFFYYYVRFNRYGNYYFFVHGCLLL